MSTLIWAEQITIRCESGTLGDLEVHLIVTAGFVRSIEDSLQGLLLDLTQSGFKLSSEGREVGDDGVEWSFIDARAFDSPELSNRRFIA